MDRLLKYIRTSRFYSIEGLVALCALIVGALATIHYYFLGDIIAYGDAESHLNIAKRVISSLTPGFAQLGGIWLPLPHLLMVPFVANDFLWRTGLAGSIVSGIAFVISTVYVYKLVFLISKNRIAGGVGAAVFMLNANILYLQSTPLTELTLIVFFILSSYYFIKFLQDKSKLVHLLLAALFGFFASLSRYDGWALVLMEAGILFLLYMPYTIAWKKYVPKIVRKEAKISLLDALSQWEGKLLLFCTLAFFGILLWLAWGYIILGDALYFTHSQFSAKSQQTGWAAKGELPAYHHLWTSIMYYAYTSYVNIGAYVCVLALIGIAVFIVAKGIKGKWYVLLILSVPFIFNVATLFLGQSIIFIPGLTPSTFQWTLFNVRYGVMMVPFAAFAVGYLYAKVPWFGKIIIVAIVVVQTVLFGIGYSPTITLLDGMVGLSSYTIKTPGVQAWIDTHYDNGYVLLDDYARTVSIIRSTIPMQNIVYIGNKPYWLESLAAPQDHVKWIIMQRDDTVWNTLWANPAGQAMLYKYYNKVYTSTDILIFERMPVGQVVSTNAATSTSAIATSTAILSTSTPKN
jgi:hypothetical protein